MDSTHWLITDKGDQDVRSLADRHYSRISLGAKGFTRSGGDNLVLITNDNLAAWITYKSNRRFDKLDAWECSFFRNEGKILSSSLIIEAVELTCSIWGKFPKDGFITFINPKLVMSNIPGYCFKRAGWQKNGCTKRGLLIFKSKEPKKIRFWDEWKFKKERYGKIRFELEQQNIGDRINGNM